jgi:hypothetical protein
VTAEDHTPLTDPRSSGENARGQAVPVLYIAGFGRSGSTLLDRLLGSTPGVHSGGEIAGLWSKGIVADGLCSCGALFSTCPFWQAVGSGSFSSMRAYDIDNFLHYMHRILPVYKMWRILSRRTRRKMVNSAPTSFLDITAGLYQRLQDVSAQKVVVDSSKLPTYLAVLAEISSLDVHVVHLVRDPRAVAHSWVRPVTVDRDGRSWMPQIGVVKSTMLWLIINTATEWTARRLRLPYVRVRYEDLVKDPAQIVRQLRSQVLREAELGSEEVRFLNDGNIDLSAAHIISGNAMRFRQGHIPIVEDADWKDSPWRRRAVVAAATFPLRWRYGYRGHQ